MWEGGRTIADRRDTNAIASSLDKDTCFPLASLEQPLSQAALPSSPPTCRKIRPACEFGKNESSQCVDCAFLDERQFESTLEAEFLQHCRTIRKFVEQSANELFSSHMASMLLTAGARIVDCDDRGESFLRTKGLLYLFHNQLHCSDQHQDIKMQDAIRETAHTGRVITLLLNPINNLQQRYSLALVRLNCQKQRSESSTVAGVGNVLCLIAPLDRRRFATVRQLMDLFGLSAAEGRLARALCHGESLEKYASDQGLKLPTVKTQLRSVFAKTGTDRQAALVRLLSGIPVVREQT